jgi:hypothetical protein
MEPLWSPAVATSRNRWQMGGRRERLRQAKTLPSVATSCPSCSMVRRGLRFESGRGLRKCAARRPLFCRSSLQKLQYAVGMEPLWSPQVQRARSHASEMDSVGVGLGLNRPSPARRPTAGCSALETSSGRRSRVDVRETAARSAARLTAARGRRASGGSSWSSASPAAPSAGPDHFAQAVGRADQDHRLVREVRRASRVGRRLQARLEPHAKCLGRGRLAANGDRP